MFASVRSVSTAVLEARTLINAFIADFSIITVLVKAITLSGWVFHMKVFFCCDPKMQIIVVIIKQVFIINLGKSLSSIDQNCTPSIIL